MDIVSSEAPQLASRGPGHRTHADHAVTQEHLTREAKDPKPPSAGRQMPPGRAAATRLVWRVAGRGSYRCQVTPVAVTVAV